MVKSNKSKVTFSAQQVERMLRGKTKTKIKRKQRDRLTSTPLHPNVAAGSITRFGRSGPRIHTYGDEGKTVVCNTEAFANVNFAALGAFSTAGTPMIPSSMSWLDGILQCYSKWQWRKLRFIYIPAVPTTFNGNFAAGLSYDFSDNAQTSIATTMQLYDAVAAPVWGGYDGTNMLNTPFCKPTPGAVYIDVDLNRDAIMWYRSIDATNFAALTTSDQNLYAPGRLIISTVGQTVLTLAAGTWFAQYECEFIEPMVAALNS
jgi:hypothetical protein